MARAIECLKPLLILAAAAAAGCTEQWLAILSNETSAPIRVRYAAPTFRTDVGAPEICPLRAEPPTVTPDDQWSPSAWTVPPALTLDFDKCEADYVLPPGFAARVYANGFCDDYERHAEQGAAFRPSLEYLIVETASGIDEWHGWDAVKQFERGRKGWCFLRVL